jgi:uncharacterized protein YlxP (DUF503 family)
MSGRTEHRAFVGLLHAELHFPGCDTLKDRRGHLRSLLDRLRNMGFSAAQVGDPARVGRAWIAASIVSGADGIVSGLLEKASMLLENPSWDVAGSSTDIVIFPGEG